MTNGRVWEELEQNGVVLLPAFFPPDSLMRFKQAASACFQSIAAMGSIPQHYRFSHSSNSVLLTALLDFGFASRIELLAPLSAPGLIDLFTQAMNSPWQCNLEQSWARHKFGVVQNPQAHPPDSQAPGPGYHLQNWHQDGALGARFPLQPGPAIPMTDLLTCWIPLEACGSQSPGLEFIRRRQSALLHFTELGDQSLRRRFPAVDFWAPALHFGDCLVFLKDVLHRTHVLPAMARNRLSIEYRIFPRESLSTDQENIPRQP
jgi:hypothetical protein